MQIQFNRPVTIGEHTYGKGQHNVPDADTKGNWFFDALVNEGAAVVLRQGDAKEDQSGAIPVDPNDASAKVAAHVAKPTGKKAR